MEKSLITVLLFTLVVVLVWVGFSVYFTMNTVNINPNANSYISPITPTFDKNSFDKIIEKVDSTLPVHPSTLLEIQQD
jgi:hypothetical protein